MTKIGVFVGSLRKDSWNRKVANALVSLLPEGYEAEFFDIGHLPLYNEDWDHEGLIPPEVTAYREAVASADAFIFSTPEYNRSVPGLLKNAIDIASRPPRQGGFAGKPSLISTATPGSLGAVGANHHLRQSLVSVNSLAVTQPELYLSRISESFDEQGNLSERTRTRLASAVDALVRLINAA